jgi:hypothetical protein
LVDAYPVNGGDHVVVDRSEGSYQTWDAIRPPGVLVSPRTGWVKAKNCVGYVIWQIKRPRPKIIFGRSPVRITGFVPDGLRASDTDKIVLGSCPTLSLGVDGAEIPPVDMVRRNRALFVPLVAWLPRRQSETGAHILSAGAPIVAGVRINNEAVRRIIRDTDSERTVFG